MWRRLTLPKPLKKTIYQLILIMKKIITLLAIISAVTFSSCQELKTVGNVGADFVGTVFEGSIAIDNAVVTSASIIKERPGVTNFGVKESDGATHINTAIGAGTRYQDITVRANGKTYRGSISHTQYSDRIYSGQCGTLYIGKKTGSFKRFEPTY